MNWSELNFGKHSGKSLPQVLFNDPDWFFWAMENGVLSKNAALEKESKLISSRAKNIKPKSIGLSEVVVEYLIHQPTGKFSHFVVVPKERDLHSGSSPAFRGSVIDMSVPRRIAKYDKLGCKSLVDSLKYHISGKTSMRITRKIAEEFFSDPLNFK